MSLGTFPETTWTHKLLMIVYQPYHFQSIIAISVLFLDFGSHSSRSFGRPVLRVLSKMIYCPKSE
jgi:hypothetical protein